MSVHDGEVSNSAVIWYPVQDSESKAVLFQVKFNHNGQLLLLASCLYGWFSQSGVAVNNCSAEMMEPMIRRFLELALLLPLSWLWENNYNPATCQVM